MNELTQFIEFIKELGGIHIVDNIVYYKMLFLEQQNLPNQIIFIRHGEKNKDDGDLNKIGVIHADCWLNFFKDKNFGHINIIGFGGFGKAVMYAFDELKITFDIYYRNEINDIDDISGQYFITSIDSSFDRGVFKQVINASRNPFSDATADVNGGITSSGSSVEPTQQVIPGPASPTAGAGRGTGLYQSSQRN